MKRLVKFVSVVGVVVMLSVMVGMTGTARAQNEFGPSKCLLVRWGAWDGTYDVKTNNGVSYVTVVRRYGCEGGTLCLTTNTPDSYKVLLDGGFPLYKGSTLYVDEPYFDKDNGTLDLDRGGMWQLKDKKGNVVAKGNGKHKCR